MNKAKGVFCFFVFVLLGFNFKNLICDIDIKSLLLSDKKFNVVKESYADKIRIPSNILDLNVKKISFKKNNEKEVIEAQNVIDENPRVYIFNTHQTEKYAKTIHNITPTVITASNILSGELKELGIVSFVENKDVTSETKKRGYDYTGTYTVSFDYLKMRKKEYPSLNYYFDIHRDSITGPSSKVRINNKDYATIMFLVGANYDGYEKTIKNVNIMKSYLDKNYSGLVRNTYIQKKSTFYQYYSSNMFLVEIGGPKNSLEEVYNSSKSLAEAIDYYIKVKESK